MSSNVVQLELLSQGVPVIDPYAAGMYVQCCKYCMYDQQHESGVIVNISVLSKSKQMDIFWNSQVDDTYKARFGGNARKTTENGAIAIALLAIREFTEYTAVLEAPAEGTRVDYMLCKQDSKLDDMNIFGCVDAYCEITGIRQARNESDVRQAINKKMDRLDTAKGLDKSLPCYVVVVEFGQPESRILQKKWQP